MITDVTYSGFIKRNSKNAKQREYDVIQDKYQFVYRPSIQIKEVTPIDYGGGAQVIFTRENGEDKFTKTLSTLVYMVLNGEVYINSGIEKIRDYFESEKGRTRYKVDLQGLKNIVSKNNYNLENNLGLAINIVYDDYEGLEIRYYQKNFKVTYKKCTVSQLADAVMSEKVRVLGLDEFIGAFN